MSICKGDAVMLSVRRKVVYVVFALMAVGMLVGPPSVAFAGCQAGAQNSCT